MSGGYLSAEDMVFTNDKPKQTWREFFKTVPQFSQRQDSTQEQLRDLYYVANKLGFYDAADFLKSHI